MTQKKYFFSSIMLIIFFFCIFLTKDAKADLYVRCYVDLVTNQNEILQSWVGSEKKSVTNAYNVACQRALDTCEWSRENISWRGDPTCKVRRRRGPRRRRAERMGAVRENLLPESQRRPRPTPPNFARCYVDLVTTDKEILQSWVSSERGVRGQAMDIACQRALETCNKALRMHPWRGNPTCKVRGRNYRQYRRARRQGAHPENFRNFLPTELPVELTGPYSNYEGPLSEEHDDEMDKLRQRFFYNRDGQLNPSKVNHMINYFTQKRDRLKESIRMARKVYFVEAHNYNDEDATKKGENRLKKSARIFLAFNIVIERGEKLLKDMDENDLSPIEVRDRVEEILLFVSVLETIDKENIFSDYVRMALNVVRLFHSLYINDDSLPDASNLIYNGKFQTQEDLKKLKKRGVDISTLNPPSTAIWVDNNIKEYRPLDETFYGSDNIFPPEGTPVYYDRMGNGTIKIKAYWRKTKEDGSLGKKKKVTIRVGRETHTTIITTHFARAVGYHSIPSVHRKELKIYLGETSYDSFISQWEYSHGLGQGSPLTYIKTYNRTENYVILKNVCLEGYPKKKKYRKIGPFRSGRNGFTNRREFRALLLFASLIGLNDTGDTQIRVDVVQDPETKQWKPKFFLSDTGYSVGSWLFWDNPGSVNEFEEWISKRWSFGGERVTLYWNHSDYNPKTFDSTKYEDVKWLLRRYIKLSEQQIYEIIKASGLPEAVVRLMTERFKLRLHNLAEDFELLNDPNIAEFYKLENMTRDQYIDHYRAKLHREFPREINEDGDLTDEIENNENNTVALLGPLPSELDFFIIYGLNYLRSLLQEMTEISPERFGLDTSVQIGDVALNFGPRIKGSREIRINPERGPHQRRYLVIDSMEIKVPIGVGTGEIISKKDFTVTAPASFSYVYKYEHYHSYTTLREAVICKFFNSIIPGRFGTIRKYLKPGQILRQQHDITFNVGTLAVGAGDHYQFSLTPIGVNAAYVNELYFSAPTDDVMEIVKASTFDANLNSGFEIQAYIRLALQHNYNYGTKHYKLYRFHVTEDSSLAEKNKMRKAYRDILHYNDFTQAEKLAQVHTIDERYVSEQFDFAFFFYGYDQFEEIRDIELRTRNVNGVNFEKIYGKTKDIAVINKDKTFDLVVTATNIISSELNFTGLWKKPPKSSTAMDYVDSALRVLDYFAEAFNEATFRTINFEGHANKDFTDFSEIDIEIDIDQVEKWVTRDEYEENFVEFFNDRSAPDGNDNYITLKMPKEISYYSPLRGRMHWQMKGKGFKQLFKGLREEGDSVCALEVCTFGILACSDHEDCREALETVKTKINPRLSYEDKKEKLRKKAEAILTLMRVFVGDDGGEDVGMIRKFVKDQDLWLYTYIKNPIEYTTPAAYHKVDYFAPEIGKFQGHSFLDRYRFEHNIIPHIYFGNTVPIFIQKPGNAIGGPGNIFGEIFNQLDAENIGLPGDDD